MGAPRSSAGRAGRVSGGGGGTAHVSITIGSDVSGITTRFGAITVHTARVPIRLTSSCSTTLAISWHSQTTKFSSRTGSCATSVAGSPSSLLTSLSSFSRIDAQMSSGSSRRYACGAGGWTRVV